MGFKDRLGTQTLRVWAGCKATVEVNCYAPVSGQIAATVLNGLPQFGDIIDGHSIIIMAKLHTGPVGVLELPQNACMTGRCGPLGRVTNTACGRLCNKRCSFCW